MRHRHGNSRVLPDVENMLVELRKYTFIEEKHVKRVRAAQAMREARTGGKKEWKVKQR